MSEEIDDVERYQKILEDWKPSTRMPRMPDFGGQSVKPATQASPQTVLQQEATGGHSYAAGSILRLNRNTYGVYDRPVPDKGYHLVHVLNPQGLAKTQGIALEGHQVAEIGELPTKWFTNLQHTNQWKRDLIMFHCYRYEDAATIPLESSPSASPETLKPTVSPTPTVEEPVTPSAPQPKDEAVLKRGYRLVVKFGSRAWDAVYWGSDDQGQVVAHKPNGHWALMHLDLDRFQNNGLTIDPEIDLDLIRQIEESLLSQQQ